MKSTKSRLNKGQTRHDLFSYFIQVRCVILFFMYTLY